MKDIIYREDAIMAVEEALQNIFVEPKGLGEKIINPLPSAKRTGKWELCGNHHLCSECDEWALTKWDEDECDEVDVLTDFCPSCGADMREQKLQNGDNGTLQSGLMSAI